MAQPTWEKRPAIERAGYLRKISAKVRERRTDLADIIVREQGKIRSLAQVEVDFTADEITYLIDLAVDLKAQKRERREAQRMIGRNIALIFEKTSTRTRCARPRFTWIWPSSACQATPSLRCTT